MVFKGENDRKRRGLKGAFCYGFDNLLENIKHCTTSSSGGLKRSKVHFPKMQLPIVLNVIYMCVCSHTLKEISDVMVNPCVMTGSSSAVRPFQTSNSTQRQPARRTCLYISTEELPASWPAETTEEEIQNTLNYFSPSFLTGNSFVFHPLSSVRSSNLSHSRSRVTEPACAYLSGMCYGMS